MGWAVGAGPGDDAGDVMTSKAPSPTLPESECSLQVGGARITPGMRDVPLEVEHPGGGYSRRVARIISVTGRDVVLSHRGYLHQDTLCRLIVPLDGEAEHITLTGRVAGCRHQSRDMHQTVVHLDLDGSAHIDHSTEPSQLVGQVLIIGDQELILRILRHHLGSTGLKLRTATNINQVTDHLHDQAVDLVICDDQLTHCGNVDLLAAVRAAGHTGPILALVGAGRSIPPSIPGSVTSLVKPFERDELFRALETAMAPSSPKVADPIKSTLTHQPGSKALLDWYVPQVKQILRSLEQAIEQNDIKAATWLCKGILETGACFGYPCLSDAARALHQHLTASSGPVPRQLLETLNGLCGRLC